MSYCNIYKRDTISLPITAVIFGICAAGRYRANPEFIPMFPFALIKAIATRKLS
jgi:hypothetical protein